MSSLWSELRSDLEENPSGPDWHRNDVVTLLAAAILLVLYGFAGSPSVGIRILDPPPLQNQAALVGYGWWAATAVLIRILVPVLIIRFVFRAPIGDFGYRLGSFAEHGRVYLFLFLATVPLLVAVSFMPGFQSYYPPYRHFIDSPVTAGQFLWLELCYCIQFMSTESFFRGFLTFALFRRFGYYAVLIMVIPYGMIHIGKPPTEAFAAIFAGLILGYLALKSRTWFLGGLLHCAVGLSMDLLAIMHLAGGF